MAQRTFTQLVDDLDQTEIAEGKGESVEFALRGATYRIDLKRANVTKFDKALAPFVAAATPIARPTKVKPATASTRRRTGRAKNTGKAANTTAAIREWAAANGHDVSPRGRIAASVQQAYDAALQSGE
jgi:hypothetical protein